VNDLAGNDTAQALGFFRASHSSISQSGMTLQESSYGHTAHEPQCGATVS
jgi:hypothetical protein